MRNPDVITKCGTLEETGCAWKRSRYLISPLSPWPISLPISLDFRCEEKCAWTKLSGCGPPLFACSCVSGAVTNDGSKESNATNPTRRVTVTECSPISPLPVKSLAHKLNGISSWVYAPFNLPWLSSTILLLIRTKAVLRPNEEHDIAQFAKRVLLFRDGEIRNDDGWSFGLGWWCPENPADA